MQLQLIQDLMELVSAPGPAGAETIAGNCFAQKVRPFADRIRIDDLGNIIAEKLSANPEARRIVLEAHLDEVGLIATGEADGFLTFAALGKVDPHILPAAKVTLLTEPPLEGIISCLPPHVLTAAEMDKPLGIEDLSIDFGLPPEKICAIPPGTAIIFSAEPKQMGDNLFTAKALDNRISLAVLVELLRRLEDVTLDCDLVILASTQEELGLRGSGPALFTIKPDVCICLDVAFAKTPDTKHPLKLGGGVVLTRGPVFHRELADTLFRLANETGVKHQIEVIAGKSNTTSDIAQISREGIPTALLSIPLRYMHTTVELIHLDDVQAEIDLILAYLAQENGGKLK